jgi:hypothetical protein
MYPNHNDGIVSDESNHCVREFGQAYGENWRLMKQHGRNIRQDESAHAIAMPTTNANTKKLDEQHQLTIKTTTP